MKTIKELETYFEENCYSFQELSIGNHFAPEGIIIEEDDGKFNFSYSERGRKNIIKSFDKEEDLVEYALKKLQEDKWNRAHMVVSTFSEKEISEAERLLSDMNIEFERNDVPNYRSGMTAYRIFVFGKDILKLDTFKKKYLHSF